MKRQIYAIMILILLLNSFIMSCNKVNNIHNLNVAPKENTNINQDRNCKCFKGIGSSDSDIPILTFHFSNEKSVSVCGFFDKEIREEGIIMSEFNVFDCSTGFSYAEYDATEICRIIERKDTLIIEKLEYLPCGKNWDWELIEIGKQTFTYNNNQIVVSKLLPESKFPIIDLKLQDEFFKSLEKRKGINPEWELEIGKLEILSLNGNEKAWNILKDYESYTGEKTDGAMAEMWKNAVATIKWLKNE